MKPIKLILIMLIVFSALSCVQQDGGLFFSIEQESEIYNGELKDDISVFSMAKNANTYFIAAGQFMYISEDHSVTDTWNIKNPSGYENYLCYNMININNTIYAVFFDIDGTNFDIFSLDVSSSDIASKSWSSSDFTKIDSAETVVDLEQTNTKLFVYTKNSTSNKYSVFSTDISGFDPVTSTFVEIFGGMSVGGEFKVDYDDVSSYWIAAGNNVLKTDGASSTTVKTPENNISDYLFGKGYTGIVCVDTDTDAGTEVFLASEEGVLLKYINDDWKIIKSSYDEDYGLFESLYNLQHIEISNDDEDINIILAGSAAGYYELQFENDSEEFLSAEEVNTSLTTYIQFSSIDLSEHIILDFFYDDETDDEKVFALCYNGGLWTNSFKDSSYRFWDIE